MAERETKNGKEKEFPDGYFEKKAGYNGKEILDTYEQLNDKTGSGNQSQSENNEKENNQKITKRKNSEHS